MILAPSRHAAALLGLAVESLGRGESSEEERRDHSYRCPEGQWEWKRDRTQLGSTGIQLEWGGGRGGGRNDERNNITGLSQVY